MCFCVVLSLTCVLCACQCVFCWFVCAAFSVCDDDDDVDGAVFGVMIWAVAAAASASSDNVTSIMIRCVSILAPHRDRHTHTQT